MSANLREEIGNDTCFECSFWLNVARNPKPHFQVINGQYFSFPPIVKKGCKVRHILTTEGDVIDSTELFNYGLIPERFKHLFRTTAHFLPYQVWRRIKANQGFQCKRLGCWDRLQCMWFNEEKKDWNEIPKDYQIGGEECPLFVNKLNPND